MIKIVFSVLVLSSMTLAIPLWENVRTSDMDYDYGIITEQIYKHSLMEALVKHLHHSSLGEPDFSVGHLVDSWHPDTKINPEELGTYTQGDILIPRLQPSDRNGIIDSKFRWSNGVVYYQINGDFSETERTQILRAMNEFHTSTCVTFKPFTGSEEDYLSIESQKTGCWSSVGRLGGRQTLNLQSPSCLHYVGTVIHELNHAVGFFHEQSRTDRDDHVIIRWRNILPAREKEFNKVDSNAFSIGYDYGSVMHYSAYAFTKNDRKTISPMERGKVMGQRHGFSIRDIAKIQAMYKCRGPTSRLE